MTENLMYHLFDIEIMGAWKFFQHYSSLKASMVNTLVIKRICKANWLWRIRCGLYIFLLPLVFWNQNTLMQKISQNKNKNKNRSCPFSNFMTYIPNCKCFWNQNNYEWQSSCKVACCFARLEEKPSSLFALTSIKWELICSFLFF